jgi:hypothetical protein
MGQTTTTGFAVLHTLYDATTMSATVMVKDPANPGFFASWTEQYSINDPSVHVELKLMRRLYENYGNFATLPDGATIVFACNWSPCKQCVTERIPEFMRKMTALGKSIRVRFRFVNFYSRAHYTPGHYQNAGTHLFDRDSEAESAYEELSQQYGNHSVYEDHAHLSSQTLVHWTVSKRVLEIQDMLVHTTHRVGDYRTTQFI